MTRAGATEDSWESGIANESADIRLASKINFHFVRVADSRQRERQRKRENERERERERKEKRERERGGARKKTFGNLRYVSWKFEGIAFHLTARYGFDLLRANKFEAIAEPSTRSANNGKIKFFSAAIRQRHAAPLRLRSTVVNYRGRNTGSAFRTKASLSSS